ncbi:MAG: thioredoxin family protein [Caldisericia bacterium]|nr:thioredoxin family protein [Caldisericia bacterium]
MGHLKRFLSVVCLVVMVVSFASCGSNVINEETVSIPCLTEDPAKAAQPSANVETKENPAVTTEQDDKSIETAEEKNEVKTVVEDATPKMLPKVRKVGRETCIPCATMTKRFKSMSPGLAGKAEFELIDIDEDPSAIQTYQLQSIPLIIFYDTQGNEIYRQVGVMEENEIMEWLRICGME